MTLPQLGCKPAEVRPNQPRLTTSMHMMARRAPPKLDRSHIDPGTLMLGNDTLGDCTSAGLGNHIRATAAPGRFEIGVRNADAILFYERSTGYSPTVPGSDQGGIESDVLTYASRNGYELYDQTLYPIWGTADYGDLNGMRNIMTALGPAYLGVQLAIADQADGVLDTDTPGDQTPGSWGGHCLLAWDYTGTGDTDLVSLLTWGTVRKATWRWVRSRIMECHGLAWRQLMPANGLTPANGLVSGQDWDTLVEANRDYLAG